MLNVCVLLPSLLLPNQISYSIHKLVSIMTTLLATIMMPLVVAIVLQLLMQQSPEVQAVYVIANVKLKSAIVEVLTSRGTVLC